MKNKEWTPPIQDLKRKDAIKGILSFITESVKQDSFGCDLMYGGIGIALFSCYNFQMTNKIEEMNQCTIKAETAINSLDRQISNLTFGKGVTGILWAIEHLAKSRVLDTSLNSIVDDDFFGIYHKRCKNILSKGEYDYLLGAGGAFLLYLETDMEKQIIDLYNVLQKTAVTEGDEIYWRQSPVLGGNEADMTINLGLAHGLPSILSILSCIYNRCTCLDAKVRLKLKDDVYKSFNWLKRNCLNPAKEGSYFPFSFNKVKKPFSTSLRWCYGDLGVSIALINAGNNLGIPEIYDFGVEIARDCADRNVDSKSIVDAHLCHGTAGIAHIFNRLFNGTGIEVFRNASEYWFDETIMKFDSSLKSGFKAWKGDYGWIEYDGLLEGSAGIGLALISAVSHVEPKWDRCLLLS